MLAIGGSDAAARGVEDSDSVEGDRFRGDDEGNPITSETVQHSSHRIAKAPARG